MSNLNQQNTITQYQANGIEPTYVFNFYVPLDSDLNVYVTPVGEDPVPTEDIKLLNVDYSFTPNIDLNSGGYITFLPGKIPPAGTNVTLSRDVKASLDVEFSNATTLNGENLDEAFERLLLLIQQNKTLINSKEQRVLSYRINAFQASANITGNTQIPVLDANQIWKGQGDSVIATTLVEGSDWSTLRSDLASDNLGGDGARILGYYDAVSETPTTVQAFLANIIPFIHTNVGTSLVPSGTVIDFAGQIAPIGYLACDGALVSRTTYADLFAAIGTSWGAGDGLTTFALPNLARCVTVGAGGTPTDVLHATTGSIGGEEAHAQTLNELATHTHNATANAGATPVEGGTGAGPITFSEPGSQSITVDNAGSGAAANIMQPSAVMTKCIKI